MCKPKQSVTEVHTVYTGSNITYMETQPVTNRPTAIFSIRNIKKIADGKEYRSKQNCIETA